MKYLAPALLVLGVLACTPEHTEARRHRPVDRAIAHTVQLVGPTGDTYCSGVIVRRVILTAAHCVDNGDLLVRFHHGQTSPANIIAVWKQQDLAAIRTVAPLPRGARLALGRLHAGDTVHVVGHSLGLFVYNFTSGVIGTPWVEDGLHAEAISFFHDAGTLPGNSGGPVFDNHYRLIGITSFGINQRLSCHFASCAGMYQDTHIAGAVHLDAIRAFFATLKPLI